MNLTYFDMAYTDRQGPIQIPDPSLPTGFRIQLVNTGDVDLSGYELEGQIAATDNFMIDFSAGLVDSTLYDPCANNGDFLFPGPVEDSYSLGGRWTMPLRARRRPYVRAELRLYRRAADPQRRNGDPVLQRRTAL